MNAADIAAYSQKERGRTNLQCGELVNDYWKKVTGSRAGIGDTYGSKTYAINSIGESKVPVPGGIFASDPLKNGIGHTGIVQSVNKDGSVTVLEANAEGKANGGPPVTRTYPAGNVAHMKFSIAPV